MAAQQQQHDKHNPIPSLPTELHITTLNVWGLKYISAHRRARLSAIGSILAAASPQFDIVGLQEVWTQEDYQSIRRQTSHLLPYGKFYHSGILGGGLAILSRFPIESSSMEGYTLNGRPTAFFRGDWYVGKGVASARLRIGPGMKDVVEVFCTHLHAPYEAEPNDSYICHRTAQAWQIAKLMRGALERGHAVLGLGDFNMVPASLACRIVETHGRVRDVWRVMYPDSSLGAAEDEVERARGREMPSVEFNLARNGTTCDSKWNTWRWTKEDQKRLGKGENVVVEKTVADPKAKRLDYIFFENGDGDGNGTRARWEVTGVKLGMTQRHPTLGCSLSDHFSVDCTLRLQAGPPSDILTSQANGSVEAHKAPIIDHKATHLPLHTYAEIQAMIHKYRQRELKQRLWRMRHFYASIGISVGCFVAVWWSPRNFVSFLLMLLSTLSFGAGLIDGIIGGLFVRAELRALKEFEWEIANAREMAEREVVL